MQVHVPGVLWGEVLHTHTRMDTCATESMFGACMCMRACEHAQAGTVQSVLSHHVSGCAHVEA